MRGYLECTPYSNLPLAARRCPVKHLFGKWLTSDALIEIQPKHLIVNVAWPNGFVLKTSNLIAKEAICVGRNLVEASAQPGARASCVVTYIAIGCCGKRSQTRQNSLISSDVPTVTRT